MPDPAPPERAVPEPTSPPPAIEPLVIDASALAEYLITSSAGREAAAILHEHANNLHIPHLAIVETTSVIRGLVLSGHLDATRAKGALTDLGDLRATRWPAEPLFGRIWQLRSNLSAYDAAYVALAETLDASLLTADARLARTVETLERTCPVILLGATPD